MGKKMTSVRFDINGVIVGSVEVWEDGDRLIYDRISGYGDEVPPERISDRLIEQLERRRQSKSRQIDRGCSGKSMAKVKSSCLVYYRF